MTSTLGRTAKPARRAPPNLAGGAQTRTLVDRPPPRLARKRNLKNLNVVAHGRRKKLTSLVRRQAANTSLSHDQGSIRFIYFSLTVCFYCLSHCAFSPANLTDELVVLKGFQINLTMYSQLLYETLKNIVND